MIYLIYVSIYRIYILYSGPYSRWWYTASCTPRAPGELAKRALCAGAMYALSPLQLLGRQLGDLVDIAAGRQRIRPHHVQLGFGLAMMLLIVLVAVLSWLYDTLVGPPPPLDEGAHIRRKIAEYTKRLEDIGSPLAHCRDASSLSPLPAGKWCFSMGRANCETFSVRPDRDGSSRICTWDGRAGKCQARPAAGLLCDPAQLVATSA